MDEMVPPDAGSVTVPGEHDNMQVGIGGLDPGGEGEGPTMGGVQTVGIDVAGDPRGAADPGSKGHPVHVDPQLLDGPEGVVDGIPVAASVAEDGGEHTLSDVFFPEFLSVDHACHAYPSSIRNSSVGRCISPPILGAEITSQSLADHSFTTWKICPRFISGTMMVRTFRERAFT